MGYSQIETSMKIFIVKKDNIAMIFPSLMPVIIKLCYI
jgi:hypothetical protein